jgi:hypothetical protein
MCNRRNLQTYIEILEQCSSFNNPITEGLDNPKLREYSSLLKELEKKEWIFFEHGDSGNLHYTSNVFITCSGLLGLAELKKNKLESNPFYLMLLDTRSLLLIAFGSILTVAGKQFLGG